MRSTPCQQAVALSIPRARLDRRAGPGCVRPGAAGALLLARGERVPLVLMVRDGTGRVQEIAVQAEVRLRSALEDERRSHASAHAAH